MSGQHTPRYSKEQTIERFWAKIDREDPSACWNWLRSVDGHGYGQIQVIAAQFGITESNVSYIAKRKGWKHVI